MYYENKKSFYIKQYGPAAAIILVAIVLIGCAIYFGLRNNSETPIAEKPVDVIVDSGSYVLSDAAFEAKVKSVSGTVVKVEANNTTYDINLIGVMENKKNSGLENQMRIDLVGKTVMVDFDTARTVNNKTYGYIYLDKTMYNAKLLENGLAELAPEKININKLDVLLSAQLTAKHAGNGIWAY